jgi:CobQ-like glutamine amidotransferase family enzyme
VDGKTIPLGKVIVGFGNNGVDKTEGAIYKNCLGTYLHGPVLPKNPHLADWLLKTALKRKYQKPVELKPLDDTLEIKTHQSAEKRTRQTKRSWFW